MSRFLLSSLIWFCATVVALHLRSLFFLFYDGWLPMGAIILPPTVLEYQADQLLVLDYLYNIIKCVALLL